MARIRGAVGQGKEWPSPLQSQQRGPHRGRVPSRRPALRRGPASAPPCAPKSAVKRAPARAVETALAIFAHDIRTPLTGIVAFGELLATSALGEREARWVEAIKDFAAHLAELTTLAVEAARAGKGRLKLRREVFALPRFAARLAFSLTARAEAKGLSCDTSIGELPDEAVGDPALLACGDRKSDGECREVHRAGTRRPRDHGNGAGPRQTAPLRHRLRQRHRHQRGRDAAAVSAVRPGERGDRRKVRWRRARSRAGAPSRPRDARQPQGRERAGPRQRVHLHRRARSAGRRRPRSTRRRTSRRSTFSASRTIPTAGW